MRGALIALVLLSCVPAAPELHPKGGFSVRLAPSAATAGKPFTTPDGWTITIKKAAFRLTAAGQSGQFKSRPPAVSSYAGDTRVLSPTADCELRLTALDVGDAIVKIDLESSAITSNPADDHPCGVDAAMLARFEGVADNGPDAQQYTYRNTSSSNVAVVADAEKDGRRIHLELFVDTYNPDAQLHSQLAVSTVEANKGVVLRFPVYFESIFLQEAETQTPPALEFEKIANADADGDGNVTAAELSRVRVNDCTTQPRATDQGGYLDSGCPTLFDVLRDRMAYADTDPNAPLVVDPSAGAGGAPDGFGKFAGGAVKQ